jgi:hypothetical protein
VGQGLIHPIAAMRSLPDTGGPNRGHEVQRAATGRCRRCGNLHKPRRYSRPLRHPFCLSAQASSSAALLVSAATLEENRSKSRIEPTIGPILGAQLLDSRLTGRMRQRLTRVG